MHPFYPVGYFALLRIGLDLGLDVARYGQFLSWSGSIGGIVAVYLLLYTATRKAILALAGVALLILHPFYRFQALQEGNDMLAAGLQLLALAVVFSGDSDNRRHVFVTSAAAGIFLGGAYLIRYTALMLLPVIIACLWMKHRREKRTLAVSLTLLIGLFGLISLPQLAASTAVTGSPFYNEQARNVWFGIYGDFNWTDNWQNIPPNVTLAQIVRDDPAAFFTHWAQEIGRFLAYDPNAYASDALALERKVTLWDPLLGHIIWLVSVFMLIFNRRLSSPQIALLLMTLMVPVLATSMAWLFTRYLLIALAIQVVLIVLAARQIGGWLARSDRAAIGVSLSLLLAFALLFWSSSTWGVKQQRRQDIVQRVQKAQPMLAAMGVSQRAEFMTNNRLYQVLDKPDHPQYLLIQSPGEELETIPSFLHQIMGSHRPDILLFDWTSHAIRAMDVKPYRSALASAKDQLAPLQLTDEVSIYCVVPCRAKEATPIKEAISPALDLVGYRAFASYTDQQGLYLYWNIGS